VGLQENKGKNFQCISKVPTFFRGFVSIHFQFLRLSSSVDFACLKSCRSIVASVCSAEQCEVKAREEGKITFRKKQKLGVCVPGINVASTDEEATDVGRRSAHSKVKGKVFTDSKVQRAGAVNNKKLLSFCEDED